MLGLSFKILGFSFEILGFSFEIPSISKVCENRILYNSNCRKYVTNCCNVYPLIQLLEMSG